MGQVHVRVWPRRVRELQNHAAGEESQRALDLKPSADVSLPPLTLPTGSRSSETRPTASTTLNRPRQAVSFHIPDKRHRAAQNQGQHRL